VVLSGAAPKAVDLVKVADKVVKVARVEMAKAAIKLKKCTMASLHL
jgi:hypothetical protein